MLKRQLCNTIWQEAVSKTFLQSIFINDSLSNSQAFKLGYSFFNMNHEFDAIARLFQQRVPFRQELTSLGNGDDASIHNIPDGYELVVSTDTAVSAVHWPLDMPLEIAGKRAVNAALSDLAAMGATPLWIWLAVMANSAKSLEKMSAGITDACLEHPLELAGGDTVRSATNAINVTVAGVVPKGKAMTRSSAVAGDDIWILGTLGHSAAGLNHWLAGNQKSPFTESFTRITPLIAQGDSLRNLGIRCCMDVSDGLMQDAGHIAKASNLQMHIAQEQIEQLPCYQALTQSIPEQALTYTLSGGEDYALLFTAPASMKDELNKIGAHQIGTCITGSGVALSHHGKIMDFTTKGYDHFA